MSSFVDKIMLPGGGRRYSGTNSKGLIWLTNSTGLNFPNHLITRKNSKSIVLYCHGNGGSLGDFKDIVLYYAKGFNSSVFALEYPSYGPAEGDANEDTVNDNVYTAFRFIVDVLGYPISNIILMGYSIGTGPTIKLASDLCSASNPPGAVVTIAAYLSICDIVRDLQQFPPLFIFADAIANRWNSAEAIAKVTCPIFLVHGMQDVIIPYTHSERLHEICNSKMKRLRLIQTAGHTHFSEPTDTVKPIASFLKEYLSINTDFDIQSVPSSHYECPSSVLLIESVVPRRGSDVILDSAREGCSVIDSMVTWMAGSLVDVGAAVVSTSADVVSNTGMYATTGIYTLGDVLFLSSNTDGDIAASIDDDVDTTNDLVADSNRDDLSHVSKQFIMPSPTKSSHLFSSRSNAIPTSNTTAATTIDTNTDTIASTKLATAESKAAAKAAVVILSKYFDAINAHDVPSILVHLDRDIAVRYRGNAANNWSSINVAAQKYTEMLKAAVDLQAKYSIIKVSTEEIVTRIDVSCQYVYSSNDSSGSNSDDGVCLTDKKQQQISYLISRDRRILVVEHA